MAAGRIASQESFTLDVASIKEIVKEITRPVDTPGPISENDVDSWSRSDTSVPSHLETHCETAARAETGTMLTKYCLRPDNSQSAHPVSIQAL